MFSLEKEKNMEELKMKRKIESLGIILMAIALIVSCKASADNATGRVTLNINAMVKEAEKALEVAGTSASAEDVYFTYTLKSAEGTGSYGAVENETLIGKGGTSITATISVGKWTAEFWGYRDAGCKELVYHGIATTPTSIGKEGGSLNVVMETMTSASSAHAFSAEDEAKNTADLYLKPISISNGSFVEGTKAEWYIKDGAEERKLDTWTWTAGKWVSESANIPNEGKLFEVAPGEANSLRVKVSDTANNIIGHEGWTEASSNSIEMCLNAVYTVSGAVTLKDGQLSLTVSVTPVSFSGLTATEIVD